MNIQETSALMAYINGLDPMFVADATRAAAWQSFLPPNTNYHGAKAAVDHHYSITRNTIKPKDILDYKPARTETYEGGTKPFCGNCQDGYTITPLAPNKHGYTFNRVGLCECQTGEHTKNVL